MPLKQVKKQETFTHFDSINIQDMKKMAAPRKALPQKKQMRRVGRVTAHPWRKYPKNLATGRR